MPVLNIDKRQTVSDLIDAGFDNVEIRKQTGYYCNIDPIRELKRLGLPLTTRIRKDGSINTEPRPAPLTNEQKREYKREWDRKRKLRRLNAKVVGEENDSINTTMAANAEEKEGSKPKKIINQTKLILSEAKEFCGAWEILLKQKNWLVSEAEKQSIIHELKALRTATKRLINKVEENAQ